MTADLWTAAEAAEKLGVSPRTVQRYCNTGKLDSVWVDGKRRKELRIIPPSDPEKLKDIEKKLPKKLLIPKNLIDSNLKELRNRLADNERTITRLESEIQTLRETVNSLRNNTHAGHSDPRIDIFLNYFEKIRPAEQKLILKIASELKAQSMLLEKIRLKSDSADY